MDRSFITYSRALKAMADENRMRIMSYLKNQELNGGELLSLMGFGQSTLSHHMKILTTSGLVRNRKQGKWVYYSLNPEMVDQTLDWVRESLNEKKQ